MADASVSFEDWCRDNSHDFWRSSAYNEFVALSNVSLTVFRKIVYLMKDCHEMNVSPGNLRERIRIVNNQDVDLLNPLVCFPSFDDPIADIVQDLNNFKNLVAYAVGLTTNPGTAIPEPVRCFYNLFDALKGFIYNLDDLWNFEFLVRNCPLFLDQTGKYLMFKKILSFREYDVQNFGDDVPMGTIGYWMPRVRNQVLIAIRDVYNKRDHVAYGPPHGSIQFYKNSFGHIRDNHAGPGGMFWSDAMIVDILEDDLPMVLPEWFVGLVHSMGLNPAHCAYYCGLPLVDFLREHTTVFE